MPSSGSEESVRSSSRTTRPRPAPSSAAARASIPITGAGGGLKRQQGCTSALASPLAVHVGLNLIFLVPGETGGMEIAAQELIAALLGAAPAGYRFTAFINRETAAASDWPLRDALPSVRVPVKARRRAQWVLGEQALLAPLAMRARAQLVHSLASTAPLWGRFRRVVTVHDLIYARFPEAHSGIRDKGMRVLVPAAARRSDRVIADSQSTRDDLVGSCGIDAERIDVVPLGLGAVQRDRPLPEAQTARASASASGRVLLSLSAKRPHKNLAALIDALALIDAERRPLLVLPGYHTSHEEELRERGRAAGRRGRRAAAGLDLRGRARGPVGARDGVRVPLACTRASGCPCWRRWPGVCRWPLNASSLPEVAGDAALLFDPRDTRAIAAAIQQLLSDPGEAERLRRLGLERAVRLHLAARGAAHARGLWTRLCSARALAGRRAHEVRFRAHRIAAQEIG